MKISLISPERNEKDILDELLTRVTKVMSKHFKDNEWEYILVDDASDDGSAEKVLKLAKKYRNLNPIFHKERKFQTGCFQSGFRKASGDFVIVMDSDLQVLPEDLPLFFDKIKQGFNLVNAIRENRQHPFWMKLASRCYNILMLLFFDCPVFDAASNYTAIKRSYVKNIKLFHNDHRYLIPILQTKGLKKIGEVVVRHEKRSHGKSKYNALPKYLKGFPELIMAFVRIKMHKY